MKTKSKINRQILGMVSRSVHINLEKREEGAIENDFPVVISTQTPARVVDWEQWKIIDEVLLSQGCEYPESRQVVMLDSHNIWGSVAETIKGSWRECTKSDSEVSALANFSSLAEKERTLVIEGHLTDVSVGYRTYKEDTTILRAGESREFFGQTIKNDLVSKNDLYVRTRWTLKEVSLVTIGADNLAKFRSEAGLDDNEPEGGEGSERGDIPKIIQIKKEGKRTMEGESQKTQEEIVKQERERQNEIRAIHEKFQGKYDETACSLEKAINDGWSADKFRAGVFDNFQESGKHKNDTDGKTVVVGRAASELGLNGKELKEYSYSRAILAMADGKWKENSFERELSDQIYKNAGMERRAPNAFTVPLEILARAAAWANAAALKGRTSLSTENFATGGALVATEFLVSEYIEYLRNQTIAGKLGITILTGLHGDVIIPKALSGGNYEMVGYGSPTESNMTFGQITMSPRYGAVTQSYHRSLLIQGSLSVDAMIANDSLNAAAVGKDNLIFNGLGNALEPLGLLKTDGVLSQSLAAGLSLPNVDSFIEKLEENNAAVLGEIKYLLSIKLKHKMKQTPKIGATYPVFLMDDSDKIGGYQAFATNQVAAKIMAAGIWNQLVLGDYGVYEVLVDPFSKGKGGITEVTTFDAFDVAVKRPHAFVVSDDIVFE